MAAAPKTGFIELVVTCGSWQEAQNIADALLNKHLVACAELLAVKSKNWWHGKLEEQDEIKLIMQTAAAKFAKVEAVVSELHSYHTPALRAVPITHITDEAARWLAMETEELS